MNKVLMRLFYWMLLPAAWIATVLAKWLMRSGNREELARASYEGGMISAEQYEAVKRGEIDLFDAAKKGYPGRKIVIDDTGDVRGKG